ncbi:hypothetical protein ACS89Q_23795, partial [Salmonella enterica]
ADRNRSHWSTSKTPSYTKSVSWQHHLEWLPEFTNNCLKHDSYGFYAALSQLLLAIVRFDDGKEDLSIVAAE